MSGLWRDIKLAARVLAKKPGFTAIAVVTLALGIGANTAIFSVVNALIFRLLPVPEARQLVSLTETEPGLPFPHGLSYPNVRDFKALDEVFADVSASTAVHLRLSVEGSAPERIIPQLVSPGFFEMLRLQALHGRTFRAQDVEGGGAGNVIVLSHSGWQNRFAGDPAIVGEIVSLNDQPFTVLGVTPEEFPGTFGLFAVEGFIPLTGMELIDPGFQETLENRSADAFRVIARLQPGVDLAAARAAVQVQADRLASEYPEANKGQIVQLHPEPMARMEPAAVAFMPPLAAVFMGLVSLVLLIACANVANLLLARGTSRQKEMGIRLAVGASRREVLRQLLAESLLLALLGGAAALLIANWAAQALSSFELATDLPMHIDLSLDYNVFAFALAAAVGTGVVTGLVPGMRAGRTDLVGALKEGGRSSAAGSRRHTLRNTLVVAQVAVSVALLVCAGLFVRTAQNATDIDMGFEMRNRLILAFDVALGDYDEARGRSFYSDLLERVRGLPGVLDAETGRFVPVGYMNEIVRVQIEGQVESASDPPKQALNNVVGPGYFRTLGTPLLEGRPFSEDDRADGLPVAIVNQAFADAYWTGEDSLGKRVSTEGLEGFAEVVGVAKTGKYTLPAESPIPMVYLPFAQNYRSDQVLFVHTEAAPLGLLPAIRTQIRTLDAGMPVFDVRTLETHIKEGKAKMFGLAATLVGIFGLIGAVLASIGLYGVTAYSVGQRRHEIGVRMALGAWPGQILALILRQGAWLAAAGVGLGLTASFVITRFLVNLLVGVSPTDPLTFGGVALLLVAVTLLACLIPARHAAKVDPMVALHYE